MISMILAKAVSVLPSVPILASGELWGKVSFAGLFLVVAAGLAALPDRWIGMEVRPRPWKNVRYWAIAVALVQLLVYATFG
jgi:hypothetical protein